MPMRRGSLIDARIVKVDIPFFDLINFLVKFSLAAVPAAIVVFLIWTLMIVFFGLGVGAILRPFIRS